MAKCSYEIKETKEGLEYKVKPLTNPKVPQIFIFILTSFLGVMIASLISRLLGYYLTILFMLSFPFVCIKLFGSMVHKFRCYNLKEFTLKEKTILLSNGKEIEVSKIDRFSVKNPYSNAVGVFSILWHEVSYILYAESFGEEYVLAGGMNEAVSSAILNRISNYYGYKN